MSCGRKELPVQTDSVRLVDFQTAAARQLACVQGAAKKESIFAVL